MFYLGPAPISRATDSGEIGAVNGLPPEQQANDPVECVAMLLEHLHGAVRYPA
jgi:hypothetical protein